MSVSSPAIIIIRLLTGALTLSVRCLCHPFVSTILSGITASENTRPRFTWRRLLEADFSRGPDLCHAMGATHPTFFPSTRAEPSRPER